MSTSEAQKKSRNKWDSANMAVIGCKVKKEQAEKFKQCAKEQGTTANNLLKKYVISVISEADTGEKERF